jgi:hypothetical protein
MSIRPEVETKNSRYASGMLGRLMPARPELPLKLKRREALDLSGDQVGGPEPPREWDPRPGICRGPSINAQIFSPAVPEITLIAAA